MKLGLVFIILTGVLRGELLGLVGIYIFWLWLSTGVEHSVTDVAERISMAVFLRVGVTGGSPCRGVELFLGVELFRGVELLRFGELRLGELRLGELRLGEPLLGELRPGDRLGAAGGFPTTSKPS